MVNITLLSDPSSSEGVWLAILITLGCDTNNPRWGGGGWGISFIYIDALMHLSM